MNSRHKRQAHLWNFRAVFASIPGVALLVYVLINRSRPGFDVSGWAAMAQAYVSIVIIFTTVESIKRSDEQIRKSEEQLETANEGLRIANRQTDAVIEANSLTKQALVKDREHLMIVDLHNSRTVSIANLSVSSIYISRIISGSRDADFIDKDINFRGAVVEGGQILRFDLFEQEYLDKVAADFSSLRTTDDYGFTMLKKHIPYKGIKIEYYYGGTGNQLYVREYVLTIRKEDTGFTSEGKFMWEISIEDAYTNS